MSRDFYVLFHLILQKGGVIINKEKYKINLPFLRLKREEKEYTQSQIAEYIGVSNKTYSAYERGYRTMPLSTAKAVADYLEFIVDDLFF